MAGKIELRYTQGLEKEWFNGYQLYGYYDVGSVRLNDMGPGADNVLSLQCLSPESLSQGDLQVLSCGSLSYPGLGTPRWISDLFLQ